MSFLARIFGGSVAKPIKEVGTILDALFTSDDERLDKKLMRERLAQVPLLAQVDLNKTEARHTSLFVAGWRPFIGWVCGIGLAYDFLLMPIANGFGAAFPPLDALALHSLVAAMLGFGSFRTFEKLKDIVKKH